MSLKEINFSCRLPLLVLFISAAIWLLICSTLTLIASLKFHSPTFLADISSLTYGRVRPAASNAMLYGFCLQAGFGVALWLLAHLGRTPLAGRGLATLGAALWNLGVTIGVAGVLGGDSTGFDTLEMPRYAVVIMFLGYLVLGLWGVTTFHRRAQHTLFVSQWFVFTALFWFPWIYTTAEMLLVARPVRGVAQAVIMWWYADNLLVVWLGLVGLATVFYLVPKLLKVELHSHYLALLTYWMLILFGSWGGVPGGAPVPAWLPALSAAATVLMIIPLIAVTANIYATTQQIVPKTPYLPGMAPYFPALDARRLIVSNSIRFLLFGVFSFFIAGVMRITSVLAEPKPMLRFTWFDFAQNQLQIYGFFAMIMFGAIYFILPQLTDTEFPRPKLIRAHFWVAALGIGLLVVPLAIGGIIQGFQLMNPTIAPLAVTANTLHFLRVSTLGDLLILAGHVIFLVNLAGWASGFYRARATAAYAVLTTDLFNPAEARP